MELVTWVFIGFCWYFCWCFIGGNFTIVCNREGKCKVEAGVLGGGKVRREIKWKKWKGGELGEFLLGKLSWGI